MNDSAGGLCVVDLFCGAGGMSTGFRDARPRWPGAKQQHFTVAFGADSDSDAIATYSASHFPGSPHASTLAHCGDIKKVTGGVILDAIKPFGEVDVLIGGPSCQGVSPAGLRNPADKRNQMLLAFVRLVAELQPKWFVMENVPGLAHSNNRALLARILAMLEEAGPYEVSGDVLLAADYGVPQFRYRLFVIGNRTGCPIRFPARTHCPPRGRSGSLATYRTVRDAIGDLADFPPLAASTPSAASNVSVPLNHCRSEVAEVNLARIAHVRQGEDWRSIPVSLLPARYFQVRTSDQRGSYGRLQWNWPAYTVTNGANNVSSGAFTHPEHDRCLSVREAARLQSFPDDYVFFGSLRAQYRQVGNAVPPKMAQAVAEGILASHFGAEQLGAPGRITRDLAERSARGEASFPVLTPRRVRPENLRPPVSISAISAAVSSRSYHKSPWNLRPRPTNPWPEAEVRLRKLAAGPGNLRGAKRARAIIGFLDGLRKQAIVTTSGTSEASVRKWIDGYFSLGLDGWRAYHTSVDRLLADRRPLLEVARQKIARVRKLTGAKTRLQGSERRLHMNAYLVDLIEKFGRFSVADLEKLLARGLGTRTGTLYVGDLLALLDAISEDGRSTSLRDSNGVETPPEVLATSRRGKGPLLATTPNRPTVAAR